MTPSDLTYFRIDWQTRLQFGETEVVIGCPFVLEKDGFVYDLDPETQGDLGPLLDLYPDTLADSSVDTEGTLRLKFASGAIIIVLANPQYEAWQVNGPDNHLVVCLPGTSGDLAVWD